MDEIIYIIAGFHLVFMLYGLSRKDTLTTGISGSIGLILAFSILDESDLLALAIFLYSIYLIYKAIFDI